MSGHPTPATRPLRGVLAQWEMVSVRWALDGDEQSALLGGGIDGPVDDITTYNLTTAERRILLLIELEPVLAAVLLEEDRIRAWLRRTNCNLGGRTPLEVMARSPDWIRWLIDSLGIPT